MLKIDRAVIEVNGSCNYSCSMCPQDKRTGSRHRDFRRKMSLIEFENNVKECVKHNVRVINLDGSGEATLNRNLSSYIKIVKRYNIMCVIFSNGHKMHSQFMRDCVDAGLDFFRFSIIGSNPESYTKWMNNEVNGSFDKIKSNILEMKEYIKQTNSKCEIGTYHLITDDDNSDIELEEYKNLVDELGVKTEIWKMHNWSGVYEPEYVRKGEIKTCGRPFSPDIVIRAGGLNGHTGAVAPCCQVLGRDEEAVLGHTSENSIEEIWYSEAYETLREQHRRKEFPDFCKNCDFIIDDKHVLLYTNHNRDLYKMYGTEFNLNDYR